MYQLLACFAFGLFLTFLYVWIAEHYKRAVLRAELSSGSNAPHYRAVCMRINSVCCPGRKIRELLSGANSDESHWHGSHEHGRAKTAKHGPPIVVMPHFADLDRSPPLAYETGAGSERASTVSPLSVFTARALPHIAGEQELPRSLAKRPSAGQVGPDRASNWK